MIDPKDENFVNNKAVSFEDIKFGRIYDIYFTPHQWAFSHWPFSTEDFLFKDCLIVDMSPLHTAHHNQTFSIISFGTPKTYCISDILKAFGKNGLNWYPTYCVMDDCGKRKGTKCVLWSVGLYSHALMNLIFVRKSKRCSRSKLLMDLKCMLGEEFKGRVGTCWSSGQILGQKYHCLLDISAINSKTNKIIMKPGKSVNNNKKLNLSATKDSLLNIEWIV